MAGANGDGGADIQWSIFLQRLRKMADNIRPLAKAFSVTFRVDYQF